MAINPQEICPDTRCPVCHRDEETLEKCPKCKYDSVCADHGCTNPDCNPAFASTQFAEWVTFCKRTDDPKLEWIEAQLYRAGIPNRRHGRSFHADAILEVPAQFEARADAILMAAAPAPYRRWYKTIDDMPDDHIYFQR